MRKILLVDWSEENNLAKPDPWWRGSLLLVSGLFNNVAKCKKLSDVYSALERFDPKTGDEVQFWCHGAPGKPIMAGAVVDDDHPVWDKVRGAKVWFRACNVAQGPPGVAFMNKLASKGIHAVGHLATIGPLGHSYLVGVRANEKAWWADDFDGKSSGPFKPRTVFMTAMSLPAWTFTKTGLK